MNHSGLTQKEKNLFGKCGIFCGSCMIHLGLHAHHAQELRKRLAENNFTDIAHLKISKDKYDAFQEVLDSFCDEKCNGCGDKNRLLDCPVRSCCIERECFTCADCSEFIEKILKGKWCSNMIFRLVAKRYNNWNIENLQKIHECGYEKFFVHMQKAVAKGFCNNEIISKKPVFTGPKSPKSID